MSQQKELNYTRIAKAIDFIKDHFRVQPSLEEIAEQVHLSPYHFQRLFTEWAGVSPKKFLQYTSVNYAKQVLNNDQASLFDVAYETGLSGTGRLHDLFINIEGMTPGEYKNGGESLDINYSFTWSRFGGLFMASTTKGICQMTFTEYKSVELSSIKEQFPKARFKENFDTFQEQALKVYNTDWTQLDQIKLHLKGTDFQLKIWEALLKIPQGELTTYGALAKCINNSKASRAVGSAIGSNPVAFLIPCHRVIQSNGNLGGYRWGATRKSAIIGWEAAQLDQARLA